MMAIPCRLIGLFLVACQSAGGMGSVGELASTNPCSNVDPLAAPLLGPGGTTERSPGREPGVAEINVVPSPAGAATGLVRKKLGGGSQKLAPVVGFEPTTK